MMCLRKELSKSQKGEIIVAKKLRHTNIRIFTVVDYSCSSVQCI